MELHENNLVSLSDLRPSLQSDNSNDEQPSEPSETELQIPFNVNQYMSGENKTILDGWLNSLDMRDKEDFVKNLSSIIIDAESKNENVINIINDYKTAKLAKLQKTEFDKYEEIVRKGAVFGTMFGLVIFIGLMSIILVMLAVERNTR